jgi:hypothetical protein
MTAGAGKAAEAHTSNPLTRVSTFPEVLIDDLLCLQTADELVVYATTA